MGVTKRIAELLVAGLDDRLRRRRVGDVALHEQRRRAETRQLGGECFTAVGGAGLTEQITAAIVIYRAAQWLAPIPIGWILLVIMRGSHWREIEQAPDVAAVSPTEPGNVPA